MTQAAGENHIPKDKKQSTLLFMLYLQLWRLFGCFQSFG